MIRRVSGSIDRDSMGPARTRALDSRVWEAKMDDRGGSSGSGSSAAALAVVGALLGALVGFLMRPAAPLVGQLPFGVVITRGSSLSGFDMLLQPLAQQSFNYFVVGAVIGLAVGVIAGRLGGSRR